MVDYHIYGSSLIPASTPICFLFATSGNCHGCFHSHMRLVGLHGLHGCFGMGCGPGLLGFWVNRLDIWETEIKGGREKPQESRI